MKIFDAEPAPGYHPEIGLLVAVLQDGTREWMEELGPVEPEAIPWQPFPGGYSIGAVLLHMLDAEAYWVERFILGQPWDTAELELLMSEQTDVDRCDWPTPPDQPWEYYLGLYNRIRARTLESLKQVSDTRESKELHGSLRTFRWVLGHVVEHDSYHGGQIVLLKQLYAQRAS